MRGGEVIDEGVDGGAGEVVGFEDGADVGADCGGVVLDLSFRFRAGFYV